MSTCEGLYEFPPRDLRLRLDLGHAGQALAVAVYRPPVSEFHRASLLRASQLLSEPNPRQHDQWQSYHDHDADWRRMLRLGFDAFADYNSEELKTIYADTADTVGALARGEQVDDHDLARADEVIMRLRQQMAQDRSIPTDVYA